MNNRSSSIQYQIDGWIRYLKGHLKDDEGYRYKSIRLLNLEYNPLNGSKSILDMDRDTFEYFILHQYDRTYYFHIRNSIKSLNSTDFIENYKNLNNPVRLNSTLIFGFLCATNKHLSPDLSIIKFAIEELVSYEQEFPNCWLGCLTKALLLERELEEFGPTNTIHLSIIKKIATKSYILFPNHISCHVLAHIYLYELNWVGTTSRPRLDKINLQRDSSRNMKPSYLENDFNKIYNALHFCRAQLILNPFSLSSYIYFCKTINIAGRCNAISFNNSTIGKNQMYDDLVDMCNVNHVVEIQNIKDYYFNYSRYSRESNFRLKNYINQIIEFINLVDDNQSINLSKPISSDFYLYNHYSNESNKDAFEGEPPCFWNY